jgi:hypothetical protein
MVAESSHPDIKAAEPLLLFADKGALLGHAA